MLSNQVKCFIKMDWEAKYLLFSFLFKVNHNFNSFTQVVSALFQYLICLVTSLAFVIARFYRHFTLYILLFLYSFFVFATLYFQVLCSQVTNFKAFKKYKLIQLLVRISVHWMHFLHLSKLLILTRRFIN